MLVDLWHIVKNVKIEYRYFTKSHHYFSFLAVLAIKLHLVEQTEK